MITILNIETATKNCSVSLTVDGNLLTMKEIAEENFSHAEKLHVFVEDILKENNKKWTDLNAIAVSQGPGSYTGLRIGVSAVKGLCYGLSIPMIALDTLEILARQLVVEKGLIVSMLDARRMEAYCAVFRPDYTSVGVVEAKVIESDSFDFIIDQEEIHLIGDGAPKCKDVLTDAKFIYHDSIVYPSAKEMCKMSFEKYNKSEFVDVAYFEPFYLKDFVLPTKKK
ncbi:MAG: tRNA (adenosine(37)-N6)-threonylcarbamoyltransferase complex dimerization subunit type 1 TsaB [Flavobacteriaceae bacterium]|jgi:tRNA threonylcarbamoyladenosine biosynthesis protein TsaB|nr:tRNA (adenosine(37)-N6)-threonylcarbamoyltransferase complex dimerization subunit type 1 TsaB [Flavobacteriaceae bacterium]